MTTCEPRLTGWSPPSWSSSAARRLTRSIASNTRWSRTPLTAPCCAARAKPCIAGSPRRWNSGLRTSSKPGRRSSRITTEKPPSPTRRSPIGTARANCRWRNQPCMRRSRNYGEGSVCWRGYPKLAMSAKGNADPEVVAALERANRLVTEAGAVGTPLHFFVLYGLWVSAYTGGAIAASLEHATNFLSVAQSQPSSGPLLVAHRTLAMSLVYSGDYRAALAHVETAASLYRPDEHRDSAFRYGQDIGVSAFLHLSLAIWHRGYPDQSARAADHALA